MHTDFRVFNDICGHVSFSHKSAEITRRIKGELDVSRSCSHRYVSSATPIQYSLFTQQRAYGTPFYCLIQNSWYVRTGIKNSIPDVLNWIYDIMKCIRDITNSHSWHVYICETQSRSWSSASQVK